jgi:hypothetical protein
MVAALSCGQSMVQAGAVRRESLQLVLRALPRIPDRVIHFVKLVLLDAPIPVRVEVIEKAAALDLKQDGNREM